MSGDSIWIIGASMTKFARYEDQVITNVNPR